MYKWLNDVSREFLSRGYLDGQSPEKRFHQISIRAEEILNIEGFADKFESYLSQGFYSLASPIISNFGTNKGLPVSCFNSYIPDNTEKILDKVKEVGIQTKKGGGTSGYFGDLRPRGAKITTGGESSGPVHFMELFDSVSNVISQNATRRGSFAAYLPVEHPDILEFLQIKDIGNKIQDISIGVCITDQWMKDLIEGKEQNRKIWSRIIQKRFESGYPYIHFTDNVNNQAPQVYKNFNLKIKGSNLCDEINLYSDEFNSFVCVLSSLNLLHWDKIIKTDAIETLIYFLDAVNEEFILKTENISCLKTANNFAKNQRALGMGVLGYHSYLQSKMIPFESMEAKYENSKIFTHVNQMAEKATKELAVRYGEPELLKGYGRRNVTTLAIAPTTSSSFIFGQVSPSIEPENSNYYTKKLAKGMYTVKNPFLKELLQKLDKDTEEVWKSILLNGGSVQHLDFLDKQQKDVFKTFIEISQKEIVIQAAQRQKFIDQGQSLNLMIPGNASPKEVSQLLIYGWELGIKGFYYQRGQNLNLELGRSILSCSVCEA